MSLDTDVAALATAVNALVAREDTRDDTIDAQVAALLAAVPNLVRGFWVDPVGGLDTNTGADATHALQTIAKAVALTPAGGYCAVNLLGDYAQTAAIVLNSTSLIIAGVNAADVPTQRALSMTTGTFVDAGGTTRRLSQGFSLEGPGHIYFKNIDLSVPDIGALGSYGLDESSSPIAIHSTAGFFPAIRFETCSITFTSTPIAQLIGGAGSLALDFIATTFVGDHLGKLIDDVTSTAGTDPTTVARIVTNLSSI